MSDARPMEAGSSLVLRAAQDRRSSFQPRLPVFEGPLEVLLRLVERQELAITEVSLAAVADQFLAHLDTLPDRDPALLAEFAAVASRLLLLKTRVLFPRQPHAPAEDDAEEDEDDLVRRLQEYRRVKEAAAALAARDAAGLRAYEPLAAPAPQSLEAEVTLAPARPGDLIRAVQRRLARLPAAPRLLALPPRISVGEMVERIAARLRAGRRGEVRFSDLVARLVPARGQLDRGDIVTVFMAILELVRRRQAEAHQPTPFGDIVVLATRATPAAGSVDRDPAGSERAADD
jgi:segregation and condensation protein A